ncbi:MAG: M60 family metallopeptidase, partial [Clostridia bacterium]|nr:M60 family metallopeptidase [Clostridia bacterium]
IPANTRDEGLGVYPKYGYTLSTAIGSTSDKVAARNALINESSYLTATGTANAGGGKYTWMDENGFLYSGTRTEPVETLDASGKQRRLYKHTASIGLYMGDVSDDEPGIIKDITMRNRVYNSYGVTGVYAPAGELIKIQLSGADMNATGGIIIHIGQALYNGQANNIWADKGQMQRIPHLLNTMAVTKDTAVYDEENDVWTAYVGSFIGGPLYIRNESATFTVRISGGVAYRHFILGYTTPEDFEESSATSTPYFDLEVWDRGVLHSGPLTYAKAFNYEQLYNAAVLWDKVSIVANTNYSSTGQGIVFLYDPFVAAGAAVAFPGRSSVNCPMGWMSSSLNYDAIVTSGSWGNFHEFHHNFQNFGIGYTGEVTNNALNLVDYSLFTKISSARSLSSYGGAGLSGWNCYTSATWAIGRVNANDINSTSGLAVYATLLHNFGQDAFIKARGSSGVNYFNRWADVTHYDFSYYATAVTLCAGEDYSLNSGFATNNYPEFVPVASVYQTGRSFTSDLGKTDIQTMQPYVIPYGSDFTVDLNPYYEEGGQYRSGSVVIGNGFNYTIKSVDDSGLNGSAKFVKSAEGIYTFTPDESYMLSGKIRVTLSITYGDNNATTYKGHALEDVDLILEFEQSHEANKAVLERTTYTYSADNMYADARAAYESGFAGYETVEKWDHSNPTQNCNTDIWLCTPSTISSFPNADPEKHIARDNTIEYIEGKLYITEDGKYRVYLRGRQNCALYWSLDGNDFTLGAYINDSSTSAAFRPNDENTYFDIEFDENNVYVNGELVMNDFSGTRWIYIREVLIVKTISSSQASYIGVGLTQWTVPLYTTETDEDGNTHYFNSSGQEVTAEEASNVDPIPPANGTYVNAYRNNYEFADNSSYQTDYFYTRGYNYNYVGAPKTYSTWDEDVTLVDTDLAGESAPYPVDKIFEEGTDNYLHT